MSSDPWESSTSTLTPAEAEAEIIRLSELLGNKTAEYESLAVTAAEAEAGWRIEYAKALLTADGGTVAIREAQATEKCARLYEERKRTEAVAEAAKMSVRSLSEQLSAARSVSASVRASLEGI